MTTNPDAPTPTLVVLPFPPDDHTGAGQRSRLMVEAACRAGPAHVVILMTRRNETVDLPEASSVTCLHKEDVMPRRGLERLHVGLARILAPYRTYRVQPVLRDRLLDILRAQGIGTVLFRYTHLFCAAGLATRNGPAILVDVDDRDDQKYHSALKGLLGSRLGESGLSRMLLGRIQRLLTRRLSAATRVWFVTPEDVLPLPDGTAETLPNVAYWPTPDLSDMPPSASRHLLFVGIHDHRPNRDGVVWFLDHCWPRIAAADAKATVRIVGRGDWAALNETHGHLPRVELVGEVDDLTDEYARARLCICPVREGGGSKIKVVEAAAFGRPVVATSHGIRGFEGLSSLGVPTADDPKGFVEACLALLADDALADRSGAGLRAWQERTWSREAFVSRVAEDIRQAQGAKP